MSSAPSRNTEKLRRRMGDTVAPSGARAFTPPPRTFAARLTLDLTVEDRKILKLAALEEGVHMSALLRALVGLWMEDTALQARAARRAKQESDADQQPRRR